MRGRWMVFSLLLSNAAAAQVFGPPVTYPPVTSGSVSVINAFIGGLEAPIVQLVDLDGDGALDLVLSDRDNALRVFTPTLRGSDTVWVSQSTAVSGVTVSSWFRFADLDGDGDQDMFTGGPSSAVFEVKNIGSASTLILDPRPIPLYDVNGTPVINELINVPAFADPDGDGDLDFFAGNSSGSIVYYENTGDPAHPSFRFVTDTYQGITIVGLGGASRDSLRVRRLHGAMSIAFGDLDADDDLDLLWGDLFSRSLYLLRNDGTQSSPQFVLVDSTFPDTQPVISTGFNAPALGDMDGDGDLDMFVAVASGFQSTHNLLLFRNLAGSGMADFRLESGDPLRMLDVGYISRPATGDVTGDGISDIVIGEGGGAVRLLRGTGSGSGIVSFEVSLDTLISLPGRFFLDPAVCDLDGNGVADLMIGDFTGRLRLFTNTGIWTEDTLFPLRGIELGQSASPDFADVDNDGDQDLVLGFGTGRLGYYENTGTATDPSFTQRTGMFDHIDVGNDAVPSFADLDDDGRVDLLVGSRQEGIGVWMQRQGEFVRYPYAFESGSLVWNAAPAVLSNGQRTYVFSGEVQGGLVLYERTGRTIPRLRAFSAENPYPNPSARNITVRFTLPEQRVAEIHVFDILGQEVLGPKRGAMGPGYLSESFSVRGLSSGVYYVRITAGESVVFPVVVQR